MQSRDLTGSTMPNYKRALVTGGAGFIGSHLTRRLLADGWRVTVVDDLSEGKWANLPRHNNLVKHKRSILDPISSLVKGTDVIFHLAAIPRLQRSVDDPLQTHKVNVDGTLHLLLEAKKHNVKRFVFASTSSVYGNSNKPPFTEDMTPDPLVPYSLQKLTAEGYCQLFFRLWGLPTIILRYFSVYGPAMNPHSPYALLIPKFMSLMSAGKTPRINGDGKQTRDFTYIDDVVEATIRAANSKISGEIINIGAGNGVSVLKVFRLLNTYLGTSIKATHGPAVVEPRITLANSNKAKKLLGWKPTICFEDGLARMTHQ